MEYVLEAGGCRLYSPTAGKIFERKWCKRGMKWLSKCACLKKWGQRATLPTGGKSGEGAYIHTKMRGSEKNSFPPQCQAAM